MRALLVLTAVLFASFLAATQQAAWADPGLSLSVSQEVVGIGLNFAGEDIRIYGNAPEGTEVVLKVDGPAESVSLSKKGKVLGLFWMTVDRAKVENMPAFHLVRSSDELDKILGRDEQARLGVDPMSASIMSQAEAVDTGEGAALSEDKTAEFVAALRDMYIKDGRYAPCVSCHRAPQEMGMGYLTATAEPSAEALHLENGQWETWVNLPPDTPLGDYTVDCYSVRDGQVVESETTTFTVKKVGLVDSLGSMAKDNGVAYGILSLSVILVLGLTIGFVFPRGRGGH